MIKHLSTAEIEAGMDWVRLSPKDTGTLELIIRRPDIGEREILSSGQLDLNLGLLGDNWSTRGSSSTPDGQAHPEMQLNLMNARMIQLIAGSKDRWPLAGDQLYVDLDLSEKNVPPGTQLEIGEALIEVTTVPHLGCKKFVERFGLDAMRFVNSQLGKALHLRGINAKVIRAGKIETGEKIRKI
ncbi:MAG: hypothetical protein KDC34_18180 [Saprospiraceae bacterium]|nr:hypothetical protein [Saprospiraceae bacterium]